jgi:hypothetical protein
MTTSTVHPVARPSNLLRTVIGVSLGAAAAMAVDVTPLVHWFVSLV